MLRLAQLPIYVIGVSW